MGLLSEQLQKDLFQAPFELIAAGPKISRGETFKGLPYVMLDYPRFFKKEESCALRTFFWWGNFISVTLHLKGVYQIELADRLIQHSELLADSDFRICMSGDEWEHDLYSEQYHSLQGNEVSLSAAKLKEAPFVKISSAIMLEQWDQIQDKIYSKQQLLYQLVMDQFPRR